MINYIIFVNVFYSIFFLYFASKIFGLKYTKVFSYTTMLLLMIPYALIIYLKMNLEVHHYFAQLDFFVGGCAWIYTFFVRQIVLVYLTHANVMHAILYQIVYLMTSLVRLYSEDWLRFIILNSEFLVTYEYVIIGIYKLITIYVASYFANIFYKKYEIVFSNKKDIFMFVFILLFGNGYMDDLISAFFSVLFLILTYWLLLKLKKQTKLEQIKKLKIKQIEMIELEYQLHQNSLQSLAKIHHDEKNHMLTFRELYIKNPEKALEYIKMWQNEVRNKLEICERSKLEMLRIGVFDDEPTHLNYICNLINEELKKRDVLFGIDNSNDLSYFQSKLDSHEMNYDVLFWDIQVKEGNSLQLARDIYTVYPNIKMVYVTNYEFYFKDVFDSNVLYFVQKSDFEKRIEAIVDKILNIYSKQKLYIMNKDCIHIVDLQDVLYIERELRVTYIKCKENIHYKNGEKLKDIFLKLNKRFVRIHNSFIVNIDYIEKITRTSVVLKNGENLPVSRKYHLKLKDIIFEN